MINVNRRRSGSQWIVPLVQPAGDVPEKPFWRPQRFLFEPNENFKFERDEEFKQSDKLLSKQMHLHKPPKGRIVNYKKNVKYKMSTAQFPL